MLLAAAFILCLAILLWAYATKPPPNYPPTPPLRVPFFGHIPNLWLHGDGDTNRAFEELYKKYSNNGVMAFHLGFVKAIFIGSYDVLSDVFKREEANMRFSTDDFIELQKRMLGTRQRDIGIIFNSGEGWREQRRFMMTTLRDFGFGKSTMEEWINEEVSLLVESLEEKNGMLLSIENFFNVATLNVLWRIVAGRRFDYSDPKLKELQVLIREALGAGIKPNIAFIFPILRRIFPSLDVMERHSKRLAAMRDFLREAVKQHRETFDRENLRDFIDTFLLKIEESSDPSSTFFQSDDDEQLLQTLADLFVAGTDTTSSALSFALLFLIREPHVQERLRKEITEVVGRDRMPKLADRDNLPYVEATVLEILRVANITPRGMLHGNYYSDLKVGPYDVARGHNIYAVFHSILKDAPQWQDGMSFNPDRFLGEEGLELRRQLVPFSVGKRICPGETMARQELFLFLTGLLQRYRFEAKDPANPPPLDSQSGLTKVPAPFVFRLIRL